MPVTLICAAPGAGKSYFACRKIRDVLAGGREVWTNVDGLRIGRFPNNDLLHMMERDECQRPWHFLPSNAFLFYDEAAIAFPPDFGSSGNRDDARALKDWLVEHRHHGQDVWFLAQSINLVHRSIRSVADISIRLNNLGHLGMRNRFRISYYSPSTARRPYMEKTETYDKSVFRFYDSVFAGSDLARKSGVPLWRRPFVLIPAALFVIGFFFLGRHGGLESLHASVSLPVQSTERSDHGFPPVPSSEGTSFSEKKNKVLEGSNTPEGIGRFVRFTGVTNGDPCAVVLRIVNLSKSVADDVDDRVFYVRQPERFGIMCHNMRSIEVNGSLVLLGELLPDNFDFRLLDGKRVSYF